MADIREGLSLEYIGHTKTRQTAIKVRRGETQRVVGWVYREGEDFKIQTGLSGKAWLLPNSKRLRKLLNKLVPPDRVAGESSRFALRLDAVWKVFSGKNGKTVEAHVWQARHAKQSELPRPPPRPKEKRR